jgi:hypothetical protein
VRWIAWLRLEPDLATRLDHHHIELLNVISRLEGLLRKVNGVEGEAPVYTWKPWGM